MSDVRQLVTALFKSHHIQIPASRMALFDAFLQHPKTIDAVDAIVQIQNQLMATWKLEDRIAEIVRQPLHIVNGTAGKSYETKFDFAKLNWTDITDFKFEGLEEAGLHYDETSKQLTGIPTQSGDIKILFHFKMEGQPADAPFNTKPIALIVNPDPKSLWKSVDSNKDDPYWKEETRTEFAPLGEKHILVSSKRGRSHANIGSFREDDFSFASLRNGWNLIVVADGAGSAKLSRKGSALACQSVVDFFTESSSADSMKEIDSLLQQYKNNEGEETQKKLNHFVYNNLGKAVFGVHKKLESFAAGAGVPLKDLHSTLIFTLFKKYDIGYALLSFGVGDCPIAVLNKDITEVTLMNWLDVGEFGGGTRFITMPEIFQSDKFATRFGFKLIDDFSYLLMMTDGIYDPKFVVEANLPDIKKWRAFLADIEGKNEDGIGVELKADNEKIKEQFSVWMDFWSPGNHDDRTLAIVF